jgi:hypothetical protein
VIERSIAGILALEIHLQKWSLRRTGTYLGVFKTMVKIDFFDYNIPKGCLIKPKFLL